MSDGPVVFSPDGSLAAVGCFQDQGVEIWHVSTGQPIARVAPTAAEERIYDERRVEFCAFAPDNRLLVYGGADQLVIRTLPAPRVVARIRLGTNVINQIVLSRDGRTLVTAGVHLPEGASLSLAAVAQRLGAVPSFLQAKGTLGHRLRELWSPEFTRRFAQRDAAAELLSAMDVDGQLVGRHPVDQAAYLWTKLALAGYILRTLGDAMEMAHGVEGRVPFLDDKVFAAAHAAAVGVRLRGGIEKKLLRAAATRAGVVTAEVAARPKHPFMAPPTCGAAAGKQEELADNPMLQDLLRSGALEAVPFFSAARVRALLDRLPRLSPRDRVATDPVLMLVLTAVLLQTHYRLGTAGESSG